MPIPTLVLVGADKGGVGKTTVSRALIDFMQDQKQSIRAFDTEANGPVLKRFWPAAQVIDIASIPGQMEIFDGISEGTITVVDIRAGMLSPTLEALAVSGIMEDVKAKRVRLMVLHVIGPTVASVREIADLVTRLQGAEHVIVRNHDRADATFGVLIGTNLGDKKVLDIPNLDQTSAEAVDQADTTFLDFMANAQSRSLRGRVKTWLGLVFGQFGTLGLVG